MSLGEFARWIKFRNKRGSLFSGRQLEQMIASLMALLANLNTKKGGYDMFDFAPHEDEPELTIEQAKKDW